MATVFLNGRFLDQDDAQLSAFDAGLQHGVGLFETMLGGFAEDGRPWAFRLEEHLSRICESAAALDLSTNIKAQGLAEAVLQTIQQSGLARARIRLTITGGDLNLLKKEGREPSVHLPTILIVAQAVTQYPQEMFENGVSVVIAEPRVNPLDPFAGHKTLNYWWRLRSLRQAASKGAGEALVFQVSNHLAGGCVSNALLVKDGVLLTPIARGEEGAKKGSGVAIPSPVLPGITRAWVIEQVAQLGLDIHKRMITIDDVMEADELILTNSGWGVLPVVRVEAEEIGAGAVGEISRELRRMWVEACAKP